MSYTTQQIDISSQFIISMIYNFLRVHNKLVKDKKENQRIFNSYNKMTKFFVENYLDKKLDGILMPCLIDSITEFDTTKNKYKGLLFMSNVISNKELTEQDKEVAETILAITYNKYNSMMKELGLQKNSVENKEDK